MGRDQEFTAFVRTNGARLLRSAQALTGDHAQAEDLVQNALIRAYVAWERVSRADDSYAYCQRIVFTSYSRMRRPQRVREELGASADVGVAALGTSSADDRDQLRRALTALPPKFRAVLVLRFYEDMSVAQTARLLGCSEASVRTQTARALAKLRLSAQLDSERTQRS